MATKIRLSRLGRNKKPFYRIMVTDSRSPRDGRHVEQIGYYNPLSNPKEVEVKRERALHWLGLGAELSFAARNLLSSKGILLELELRKQNKTEDDIKEELQKFAFVQELKLKNRAKKKKAKISAKSKMIGAETATQKETTVAAVVEAGESGEDTTVETETAAVEESKPEVEVTTETAAVEEPKPEAEVTTETEAAVPEETETAEEQVSEEEQASENGSGTDSNGGAVDSETDAEAEAASEVVSEEPDTKEDADTEAETASDKAVEEPVENSGEAAEDSAVEEPGADTESTKAGKPDGEDGKSE